MAWTFLTHELFSAQLSPDNRVNDAMTNKTKQLPHIQICQFCCIVLYFPSSQKFKLTLPFQPNLLMSQDSNSQESDKSHRDESWVNLIYGVVSQDKWVKSRWLKSWIESGLLTWVNKFPFNHVISAKSVINDTFFYPRAWKMHLKLPWHVIVMVCMSAWGKQPHI